MTPRRIGHRRGRPSPSGRHQGHPRSVHPFLAADDGDGFGPHDHDPHGDLPPVRVCPNCDEGQWAVEVLTGDIYLIDLDATTITRLSAPRLFRQVFDLPERSLSIQRRRFRQDGRALRLVNLDPICYSKSINMLVNVRGDGLLTYRATAPVTSVWALPPPSADEKDADPL